jgi:hypothetical protein
MPAGTDEDPDDIIREVGYLTRRAWRLTPSVPIREAAACAWSCRAIRTWTSLAIRFPPTGLPAGRVSRDIVLGMPNRNADRHHNL